MCECHVTHNIFVRDVGMHFEYCGDDDEFERRYADALPSRGGCPSLADVLADVKAQRDKRLRAPGAAQSRAERIQQSYERLHDEVFALDPRRHFASAFLEVSAAFGACGTGPAQVAACLRGLRDRGLLEELRPGLWTCKVLTEAYCDLLEAELKHFAASGLPKTAPNTMNRHGVILSELGFGPKMVDPLVYEYVDPIAKRLLPLHCEGLDSYRAFTVLYDAAEDGDRELALHYDNAEVTLNVNIGGDWEGGQVAFYGLATEREDCSLAREVVLRRGHGVLHAGLDLHKALPITAGRRHNLIVWCRSSPVRNHRCPMCFQQPRLAATNCYGDEGFRVPDCHWSATALAEGADDDLYS